jgi:hypothetical protein
MNDLLTIKDIAVVLDVQEKSARLYHESAQRRRREHRPRDKDMPAPDLHVGRTPVWHRATIEAWKERRGKTPAKALAA